MVSFKPHIRGPTSGSSAPASLRPQPAVLSPTRRGTAGRHPPVPTARGRPGRRRLSPDPSPPAPSSSGSEGGGLRLKTLGLRVFSAAAAAAAATSPSSRPRTQRCGRRMPVDAHLFPEFLLPGPAKAAVLEGEICCFIKEIGTL
ncbi:translation initiation factor IF-2-like [Lemur catta]|nr:translation initiation factor IF-2-like [Lemur catta]